MTGMACSSTNPAKKKMILSIAIIADSYKYLLVYALSASQYLIDCCMAAVAYMEVWWLGHPGFDSC